MVDRKYGLYLSFVALPALIFIVYISVYTTPLIHSSDLDKYLKKYYLAYAQDDKSAEFDYRQKIFHVIDHRLWPDPSEPLAKYIWVGMLSGNEDIALVSGSVHFSYLLKSKKATNFIIILSAFFYTSCFLVGVIGICHNILTYIFRFYISPNRAYLIYFTNHCKELNIDYSGKVSGIGYAKALFAFFPGWLIGLLIGYYFGSYNLYLQNPIVSTFLFGGAHLYCACTGSILIIIIQQIIGFLLMRFNIDIINSYIDDFICVLFGVSISTIVLKNGLGITVSVTLGTLLLTIAKNSAVRLRNKYVWDLEEDTDNDRTYVNEKYSFSFTIPTGWKRRKLVREFRNTGGQIAITHKYGRATFNLSVGLLDHQEWIDKETRASAAYAFLLNAPSKNENIKINTLKAISGEQNVVYAEYKGRWPIAGIDLKGKNGLISIYHNALEYVIQWVALPEFEDSVYGIISTFKFLNYLQDD